MRVRQLELIEVQVPARPGSISPPELNRPLHKLEQDGQAGWTRQFDEFTKWILVATCDDGTTGLGESYRGIRPSVLETFARSLLGCPVEQLRWSELPLARCREYDAIEILVLDLLGKYARLPVSHLLGGGVRDHVLVSAWSSHRTPAGAAEVAQAALEQGMHHIKFKCSLEDDVVAWATEIHSACGDRMQVILDPNERWEELRLAAEIARGLEFVGNVKLIEDPLPHWDLGAYGELRARTRIPIAYHAALGYAAHGQKPEDVILAIRERACDVFNLSGSVSEFMRMSAVADLAHIPYWHGSEVDLGILEAAYVHGAAAAPGCTVPSDIFGRRIREHDLLATPLQLQGEWVKVPSGAGLGVELDLESLAAYEKARLVVK